MTEIELFMGFGDSLKYVNYMFTVYYQTHIMAF